MSEDIRKEPTPPSGTESPRDGAFYPEVRFLEAPPFPRTVAAAGVIWIIVGSLPLLSAVASVIVASGFQARATNGGVTALISDLLGMVCFYSISTACPLFCAIMVLIVGIRTVRGRVRDTLGNGVWSMVIGVLLSGAGSLLLVGHALSLIGPAPSGPAPLNPDDVLLNEAVTVLAGVAALIGICLLMAGVLALIGRRQYKMWRAAPNIGRHR